MLDLPLFRSLRRSPGYSLTVVLTLALGIGANTAIFSLIYGILLAPLPYRDGEDLVVLRQRTEDRGVVAVSIPEFYDYRNQSRALELVEYHQMNFTLLGRAEPERVSTGVVSHNFFDVLGVAPLHGRFFSTDDEEHGAEAVLVLSYDYFERSFGGDRDVVGSVFEMNDRPHTVIGVLPPIPQFPNSHDVYMPSVACPFRAAGEQQMHTNRSAFRGLTVFGRLKDGAGVDQAVTDARTIAQRFAEEHEAYGRLRDFSVNAVPLFRELTRNARPMLLMLLAATGLVLLLACTNVANLTLSRLLARRRELAVRAALGADRWRLARRGVGEALVLSLTGAGLGVALAAGSLEALKSFASGLSPRAATVELDGAVLLFALAVALTTALTFGAVPILSRRLDLATELHGGHGTAGGGKVRTRGLLVALQVAVSVVLLVGAGLLLRSFDRLQRVDPGFNPERVLTAQVALNWSSYTTRDQVVSFFDRVLERLQGHPDIASSAVGSVAPLTQQGAMNSGILIEGRSADPDQPQPTTDQHFVSESYFTTLEIPLELGRFFDSRDHADSPPVALVNATSAARFWPGEDPIGRRLSFDNGTSWIEVVGVVGDVRQYGLDREASEELYRPLAQTGFSNRLVVRTRSDPATVARDLKNAVHAVDPRQPIDRIETLESAKSASLATPRTTAWLLALFATLALAVTIAGVAGVVMWSVGQRTREIGVRMVLGAKPASVVAMVLRQGLSLIMAGVAVGLAGAFFFARLLEGLLFETSIFDPVTIGAVPAVLLGAGLLACLAPARRAVSVEPNEAVRAE